MDIFKLTVDSSEAEIKAGYEQVMGLAKSQNFEDRKLFDRYKEYLGKILQSKMEAHNEYVYNIQDNKRQIPEALRSVDPRMVDGPARDPTDYRQEYDKVTAEIEKITPMFGEGQFNNRTFQRVFEMSQPQMQHNNRPPDPLDGNPISAQPLIDQRSQGRQPGYEHMFSGGVNPDHFSQSIMDNARQPTHSESALSRDEIRRRLDEYKNFRPNIPPLHHQANLVEAQVQQHLTPPETVSYYKQSDRHRSADIIANLHTLQQQLNQVHIPQTQVSQSQLANITTNIQVLIHEVNNLKNTVSVQEHKIQQLMNRKPHKRKF
jgi:hypothetical protein